MSQKLTVIWKCTNPFCSLCRIETEPLSAEYSTEERNVALCPQCGNLTLIKVKEVWDVSTHE